MIPVVFDFFNYSKNPVVAYCLQQYPDKQILTLKDCLPDIMKLKHSRYCYEHDLRSMIGNELRLYYATVSDDFVYVDADSIVYNLDSLQMDCACPNEHRKQLVNEGGYFRANKNTEWCKFYVDLYEHNPSIINQDSAIVYTRYPFNIPVQELDHVHYYVNRFNKFPKSSVIYYTKDKQKAMSFDKPIWCFGKSHIIISDRVYMIHDSLPIEVFKEQLRYSMQDNKLEFKEL